MFLARYITDEDAWDILPVSASAVCFFDASDYGWATVLCQRLEPHGSPEIIALIAKAFQDVQLRWSAMDRELYALWQGVVGHERLIKGFKFFCYMDHKNNLFSEAQLDNRRRSKKMSN